MKELMLSHRQVFHLHHYLLRLYVRPSIAQKSRNSIRLQDGGMEQASEKEIFRHQQEENQAV